MTIIWCMVPELWSVTDTIFCHFGQFFAFYPPNNQKNQNFEKMKKTPGDIIILKMCNINGNNMMYGSWDMEHDKCNFFVISDYFLYLYPPNKQKNQNFEKMKKTPGDVILQLCTIIIWCMVLEIWSSRSADFFCHFGSFFALLPH